jgi:HK97 family phage portal protein
VALNFGRLFARRKAAAIQNTVVTGLGFNDLATLFAFPTSSGASVTAENAARAIPVRACTSLIAGAISSMPLRIVRRDVEDGMMVQRPADDHDLWWLLNEQPNSDCTSAMFWDQVLSCRLLRGRAYARIVRKLNGRSIEIDEIVYLPFGSVTPVCEWDAVRRRDRIVRYVVNDQGRAHAVLPEDMLDFSGRESNCVKGMSDIVDAAREAIGLVLTIEEYCGKFFANGGTPRVVLQYPAGVTIDSKQQDALRESWLKRLGGSSNAAMPLVLANGGTANKVSATAEEAQMLEARKFQVIEIARAFGVPPFMIGESEKTSTWGTGIEQMSQGFIRYTLGPHITAIEQELNRKLFRISRFFVDFDEEALARGDMKSLGEWFRQAIGGSQGPGYLTVNEVRRKLNVAPIDGGDELFTPNGATTDASQSPDGASSSEPSKAETV